MEVSCPEVPEEPPSQPRSVGQLITMWCCVDHSGVVASWADLCVYGARHTVYAGVLV